MSIGTQLASDDFHRPDENPLSDGGLWQSVSPFSNCQIISDICEPTIVGADLGMMVHTGGVPPDDQYGEITVGAASSGVVGMGVRVASRGYVASLQDGQASNGILLFNGSAFGTLSSGVTSVRPGDVWRLVASGSLITLFQNGIKRYQVIDSTYLTGGSGSAIIQQAFSAISDSEILSWAYGSAVLNVPSIIFAGAVATITGNDDGVTLTYTTDGSDPVPGVNGTVYTGPFSARFAVVVKAVASLDGYTTSSVGSATMNPDPPFPHFNPENISAALFALLQTADYPFETYDRKGALPENVPAANQPYLGLVLLGAAQVENQAQGLEKWLLHFRVLVYIRADASSSAIPATELNNALQAIVEVLRTSAPIGERKTLGGIVDNCWINGDVLIDTGILDQQCALLIPITVDTGF